jgi:glycosyltransferase involved in cell wall biosynthesis
VAEAQLRQLRVLHLVSSGAIPNGLQQSLFMPLLTRLPKARVKAQVICLSPNVVPAAVLRQSGMPVYELALSRHRFSVSAFKELMQAAKAFRPDVVQAWGHTAQIASISLRKRCDWKPRVVWTVASTSPLARDAGLVDRQKLKYAAKLSAKADRIVYASEASASQHRRVGFPDGGHLVVPPGLDAVRFKPDFAARGKLREQMQIPHDAFVVGMFAPFQAESDYASFLKAAAEVIKANPHLCLLLAGHGLQKGNAPLLALLGSGTLAQRTHLLGEWSDLSALFNACEVVCSSALNDTSRMTLAMAMLCGIPCVGTGMGAQGEVIGQHGVAIESGSPAAMAKGITRLMQLTPEKRAQMAQGARKHALKNFVYVQSLQKYLQLYYDLVGRESLVAQDVPAPQIDATVTVPPPLPKQEKKPVTIAELSDPDSLEAKVQEQSTELPRWRVVQEEERARKEAEISQKVASTLSAGDVLQVLESQAPKAAGIKSPMDERARGVTEDVEELLSPEMLATPVPGAKRAAASPAKPVSTTPPVVSLPVVAAPVSPTPVTTAPIADDTGNLPLFPAESLPPVAAAVPSVEEPSLQLELLPDPLPESFKRAVGGSN